MDPGKLQTICQIGIGGAAVLGVVFGFGNWYFGKQTAQHKHEELKSDVNEGFQAAVHQYEELKSDINKGFSDIRRDIRNATIQGSPELVAGISPQMTEWNFKAGTFEVWLKRKVLFNGKRLELLVRSRDGKETIRIHKTENDIIEATYNSPEIGTVLRRTQILKEDCKADGRLFVAFCWDLSKQTTTLFINGSPRNDPY